MANPNVIVTQFPDPTLRHAPIIPGSEQLLIDAAQVELATLQRIGGTALVIPEVSYTITSTDSEPRITVSTAIVEGESFPPGWDWPALGADAPHQDKAREVASCLDTYYDNEVLGRQPEFFLGGIANITAWAVTPAGQLTLRHTAPLMIAGNGPTARNNVAAQYAIMYDWVRNLQPKDEIINEIFELDIWGKLHELRTS